MKTHIKKFTCTGGNEYTIFREVLHIIYIILHTVYYNGIYLSLKHIIKLETYFLKLSLTYDSVYTLFVAPRQLHALFTVRKMLSYSTLIYINSLREILYCIVKVHSNNFCLQYEFITELLCVCLCISTIIATLAVF